MNYFDLNKDTEFTCSDTRYLLFEFFQMVDNPSHYSLAQEVASAIQSVLLQSNINLNININLNFFINSLVPNWLLVVILILLLIFLVPIWQKGKYNNSSNNEKNKEGHLLQGGNFQTNGVFDSDANAFPNILRKNCPSVDQIARGTALVVDNRKELNKGKKYRSTSFLGQIRLQEYMYPAWFTAGHVIFPDVEKMGPENLKNIDLIFNNIKGKDNIHGQEQQEGDPILIQADKIMISKTYIAF